MIRENVRDEQVKIVKYNHLVANLIIFHNVQSMTKAFREIEEQGEIELNSELLGLFSPYRTNHISKFGAYELRDREVADLEHDFRFLEKSAAIACFSLNKTILRTISHESLRSPYWRRHYPVAAIGMISSAILASRESWATSSS